MYGLLKDLDIIPHIPVLKSTEDVVDFFWDEAEGVITGNMADFDPSPYDEKDLKNLYLELSDMNPKVWVDYLKHFSLVKKKAEVIKFRQSAHKKPYNQFLKDHNIDIIRMDDLNLYSSIRKIIESEVDKMWLTQKDALTVKVQEYMNNKSKNASYIL